MAEPISLASGIAALISLTTTVLTAGYKYVNSISSAPEEFKSLMHEVAALSVVLSQVISHSLSGPAVQQAGSPFKLIQQDVLLDCEKTLLSIQSLISDFEFLTQGRRKNVVNTLLWPQKQKEIVRHRESLGRLCAILHAAISIESVSTLRALKHEHHRGTEAIQYLTQNADDIQKQKILDWLSSLDPSVKHSATMLLKQPGTYEWFLQDETFLNWLDRGKLLWLHGASGTGKTVLISSAINHLMGAPRAQNGGMALAYHYCDFANPSTLDPSKIVGSLIRQLALQRETMPPAIQTLYNECAGQYPRLDALLNVLAGMIIECSLTTHLIIDGLDESPDRRIIADGMQRLFTALANTTNSLRILISSRPESDIRQALSTPLVFSLNPWHIERDIEIHVRAELAKMPKMRALPQSAQDELISDLVKRAEGMFRWIDCQLDHLRKIRTPQALKHALQTLPAGLEETYDRILSSIDPADHEYVLRMLHWLVESERPMSFRELAEAIALNPDKDRLDPNERLILPEEIFELCGSLVRIEENQTIVLAHFSVKEYLLSDRLTLKDRRLAKFALQNGSSGRHVSMCLLSYVLSISIRIQSLQQDMLDEEEFPLLPYLRFARFSRYQDFDTIDPWMEKHLFAGEFSDNDWLLLLDYVKPPATHLLNYYVALYMKRILRCSLMCFMNGHMARRGKVPATHSSATQRSVNSVAALFLHLQKSWEGAGTPEDDFRHHNLTTVSPLSGAAALSFDHVMRFLLENGALVDGIPSFYFMGNPLLRALRLGSKSVVRVLEEYGADINIRSPGSAYSTALTAAATSSAEMVEYLLEERKVDTNIPDVYGRTIHYWAIHDTDISRTLKPYSARLEALREREADFQDLGVLYSTILTFLRDIKAYSVVPQYYNYGQLAMCLFRLGPEYHDYAAAFAEQELIRGNSMIHYYSCDLCQPLVGNSGIRGPRFVCLECINVDLCADCYSSWEKSHGEMDKCKGHTFFEVPRRSWYHFTEGAVMENGSTFPQVISCLEEKFSALLEGTKPKSNVE